jgi:vacuolar-type H+-ATPase subunit C/Vma6
MPGAMVNDFDYLTARLHGRRSRLAEAERLDELCGLRGLPELGVAIYQSPEFPSARDLQRRLTKELVFELAGLLKNLEKAGAELVGWILVRFQIENVKVLLRAFLRRTPLEGLEEFLVALPRDLAVDASKVLAAKSLDEFADRLPAGPPRQNLKNALAFEHEQKQLFLLEGALDCGYFQELLDRGLRLTGQDRELVHPILLQEVNAFQLLLVLRGKFNHGLAPQVLSRLHVPRSGISRERFSAMLEALDVSAAAAHAVGRGIDAIPPESESGPLSISGIEALAWQRFLRLSNRAFRRGHLGLGAVVGYVGIRRIEVANLVMLSEGMVAGAMPGLRARLLPRADWESRYV